MERWRDEEMKRWRDEEMERWRDGEMEGWQHNDARMNLAIALSSARYGAAVANYTEVVRLLKATDPQGGEEQVCGARCRDVLTGREFDVKAKCVINATGPFTDSLRKMDRRETQNICQPSAGVHIVIPGYYR
ncbi:Glycerol-3-phosphate dehydrogenase, mitochondrial [Liparis tanakae]|uniref:glycerol-3-phosphate dehydrogenase n=1 Tax=Liparis tanakae TaxID=230148 RepID=A0A4Z2DYK5_9TELE|nr:Glycerol-3-phosphate dehydrogenase, mitochondrial [Liparis tanakae]